MSGTSSGQLEGEEVGESDESASFPRWRACGQGWLPLRPQPPCRKSAAAALAEALRASSRGDAKGEEEKVGGEWTRRLQAALEDGAREATHELLRDLADKVQDSLQIIARTQRTILVRVWRTERDADGEEAVGEKRDEGVRERDSRESDSPRRGRDNTARRRARLNTVNPHLCSPRTPQMAWEEHQFLADVVGRAAARNRAVGLRS